MFNLTNLFSSATQSRSHLVHYVSLRWKRKPCKPFWLGIAKSKRFKVPLPKELPQEEKAELDRLQAIYARQMRALQNFMSANATPAGIEQATMIKSVEGYAKEGLRLNKEWNEKSALLREERFKKEFQEREQRVLDKIMKEEELQRIINERATEIVKTQIELSKTFVTEENLDKVIDECLSNVKNYNFAIDLKGNIYEGESMKPTGNLVSGSAPTEQEMIPVKSKGKITSDYENTELF